VVLLSKNPILLYLKFKALISFNNVLIFKLILFLILFFDVVTVVSESVVTGSVSVFVGDIFSESESLE